MNKRVITVIVLMAVVIALCAVTLATTCVIAEEIVQTAKQLQSHPDDAGALKLFEEQWEKYEKLLSCYIRHSELENIGSSVKILHVLMKEDESLFVVECDKIITAAHHMKATDMPYLRNIF